MFLGSIGIGTHPNKILLLELSYQFSIGNNEYSELNELVPSGMRHSTIDLIGIIKLGFGVSFDL